MDETPANGDDHSIANQMMMPDTGLLHMTTLEKERHVDPSNV
jgi:hypothetical protein